MAARGVSPLILQSPRVISKPRPTADHSAAGGDSPTDSGQPQDQKSAFVLGLAESQGTLAVVAALLAGFSYSGFCSVTREELTAVHFTVQYAFSLSNALSASMALFVTIVCSLCEQQGRVARSFAVLRNHEPDFEETVHEWWKSFAQIRTNAVFVFIYSIPVFFVSMACIALIKLPPGPCVVALGILTVTGVLVFQQLTIVNDNFRARILRFFTSGSTTGFAPPSLDAEPTEEDVSHEDMVKTTLSEAVIGTIKNLPRRQQTGQLPDVLEESAPPPVMSVKSEGGVPRKLVYPNEISRTAADSRADQHDAHSDTSSDDDEEPTPPRELTRIGSPPEPERRNTLMRPRAKSLFDGSGGTGGSAAGLSRRRTRATVMLSPEELDELAIAHAHGM